MTNYSTAKVIGGLLAETGWPMTGMSILQEVDELLDQALLDGVISSRFGSDVQRS